MSAAAYGNPNAVARRRVPHPPDLDWVWVPYHPCFVEGEEGPQPLLEVNPCANREW
ncbi:hypothetical protein PGTUg99_029730 [Puccinia graminis f. sp. tritici]|uniref:Uncharacterized protein n=1 Tax=Puccinia graminis f. sp. tritici TaxID=56615 RepID=A0A5B0R869_PUCGR|nr:hypothetical protein PGTUg99_029730 [Puccinia graminis f. sp. tritici]